MLDNRSCIHNKPVVRNDTFEQELDFLIFGKNSGRKDSLWAEVS